MIKSQSLLNNYNLIILKPIFPNVNSHNWFSRAIIKAKVNRKHKNNVVTQNYLTHYYKFVIDKSVFKHPWNHAIIWTNLVLFLCNWRNRFLYELFLNLLTD